MASGPVVFPSQDTINDIAFHEGDIAIKNVGDQVTCENGHVFGTIKKTLMAVEHRDPEAWPISEFIAWNDPAPTSQIPEEGYKCKCGGFFILHGDPRKPLGDPSHDPHRDKSVWPDHEYEFVPSERGFDAATGQGSHFVRRLVSVGGAACPV
jgi:hypothetical protein